MRAFINRNFALVRNNSCNLQLKHLSIIFRRCDLISQCLRKKQIFIYRNQPCFGGMCDLESFHLQTNLKAFNYIYVHTRTHPFLYSLTQSQYKCFKCIYATIYSYALKKFPGQMNGRRGKFLKSFY